MTVKNRTDSKQQAVHLGHGDVTRTEDGLYELPLLIPSQGEEVPATLVLSADEAAVLHAQLDHQLNDGWAMSETDKTVKRNGDITT